VRPNVSHLANIANRADQPRVVGQENLPPGQTHPFLRGPSKAFPFCISA
jgi:hypothetical protein